MRDAQNVRDDRNRIAKCNMLPDPDLRKPVGKKKKS